MSATSGISPDFISICVRLYNQFSNQGYKMHRLRPEHMFVIGELISSGARVQLINNNHDFDSKVYKDLRAAIQIIRTHIDDAPLTSGEQPEDWQKGNT